MQNHYLFENCLALVTYYAENAWYFTGFSSNETTKQTFTAGYVRNVRSGRKTTQAFAFYVAEVCDKFLFLSLELLCYRESSVIGNIRFISTLLVFSLFKYSFIRCPCF